MELSVLFKPLSMADFRWQGEFTPQIRGPQAYSLSSALPLPSTTAGALVATLIATRIIRKVPNSVLEGLSNVLGDKFIIRGPYYYLKGSDGKVIACFYKSSNRLLCLDDEAVSVIDVPQLESMGIALNSLSRITLEGYMYTKVSSDLISLVEILREMYGISRVENHGILIEIYNIDSAKVNMLENINDSVVTLGGEQRAFRVKVLRETPIRTIIGRSVKGRECTYWYIATPILLCTKGERVEPPELGWDHCSNWCKIDEIFTEQVISRLFRLDPCDELAIYGRITFSVIGLGYDMVGKKRRRYCAAIMPGSAIRALSKDWEKRYVEGVGSYSNLGWGTIIPLHIGLH